jgi:NAD+ synthase (glutamine-hydrolysing)
LAKGRRRNAAAWIENGRVAAIYHKRCLPNYGVFDEQRYFVPGESTLVRSLAGVRIGVTICEDIWVEGPHLTELKAKKPQLVVNISASPYHAGKLAERHNAFRKTLKLLNAPLLYANMVGGQDELVFDGGSFVELPSGKVAVQCPEFEAGLFIVDADLGRTSSFTSETRAARLSGTEEIFQALVLGTRDYFRKNGFRKAVIGLSGGIDSSLVAAIAVEALGRENVVGVTMPSRFNLQETQSDAERLAKNLGIEFLKIPIQSIVEEFLKVLGPALKTSGPDHAQENLQARVRGTALMALSNQHGWLVLTTGNKSEISTGYCTLYGDTAGGFALLKDVLKTTVYALSKLVNEQARLPDGQARRELIPESVITRPPTAELRENQKDEDTLGAYSELDPLIVGYIEKNLSAAKLIDGRPDKADYVRRIVSMIDRNEYKRRQAAPGVKITPRSFGRDHRMPITNRYRGD